LAELAPQLPKVMLLSTLLRRSVAHQHVVLPVSGAEQSNTSGARGAAHDFAERGVFEVR
jgi:hypothetical protein